nr:hypothetical protein CFP56_22938 [Quercus suber]
MSFNSFSGLLPMSLLNLPNLSTLYLGYNQLVGPLPNHLVGIVAVEVIGSRSSPLQLTLRSCLESSCLEIKKTGSTLRDQKEIAIKEG